MEKVLKVAFYLSASELFVYLYLSFYAVKTFSPKLNLLFYFAVSFRVLVLVPMSLIFGQKMPLELYSVSTT